MAKVLAWLTEQVRMNNLTAVVIGFIIGWLLYDEIKRWRRHGK